MLTKDQVQSYFESRLNQRLNFNLKNLPAKCPFHEDRNASLSIHAETGKWKCWAGCGQGGLVDFEMLLSKVDRNQAHAQVSAFLGVPDDWMPYAVHPYVDSFGRTIFEKIQSNSNKMTLRRKDGEQVLYDIRGIDPPLFGMDRVVVSRFVFVVRDERSADILNAAFDKAGKKECAATCPYDGENRWRREWSISLSGKAVSVIYSPNARSAEYARDACRSLIPFAHAVKELKLTSDLCEHLKSKSVDDLLREVKAAPKLSLNESHETVFVSASEFMGRHSATQIEWLVEGAIQRGGNGMIVAPPGSGKSYLALDLSLSLAMKAPFLGLRVSGRRKVAYMSREDHSTLTAWRMKQLYRGKQQAEELDLDGWMMMNSKREMPIFSFDSDEYLTPVTRDLEKFAPDVMVFDVLKVMHGSEENDNTQMSRVMEKITRLTTRLNCQAIVVHHEGKGDQTGGSLKKRARGATAIGGWPEWVFALSITNPHDPQREWIRRVEFESKMGPALDPIDFMIQSGGDDSPITLKVISHLPPQKKNSPQQISLQ